MVIEHRAVFDLEDIKSVVFECSNCGGRFAVPANQSVSERSLLECHYCRTEWHWEEFKARPFTEFMAALRQVTRFQETAESRPFRMRLEFDGSLPAPDASAEPDR